MTHPPSHPLPLSGGPLHIEADRNSLAVRMGGRLVNVRQKWRVFYALLAVQKHRYVCVDEICDYYPWNRQLPKVVGREIWRFTTQQEARHFGRRISCSPSKQATKQYGLCPHTAPHIALLPDQSAVAGVLQALCFHHSSQAIALSECTLLMQSGFVDLALGRLQGLKTGTLTLNDHAHVDVLISMCLDRLYGTAGTEQQRGILEAHLSEPSLSRLNRMRILIRLARHHALSGHYERSARLFEDLSAAVRPEDGVEYCQFHINYSLLLRRTGDLPRAISHQTLAYHAAHEAQWWYGVQAAQSNLALMHLSQADQARGSAAKLHLRKAKEWALLCVTTTDATIQGADHADSALTLAQAHRRLGELDEALHWAEAAVRIAGRVPNYPDLVEAYEQLALTHKERGNHLLAALAEDQMREAQRHLTHEAGQD